jgi:hypothetical protein
MTGEYADREKRPEPKRNERSIYDPVYEEPKPTSDELDVTAIPGYGADYAKDYPALQGDTFAALIAAHTKETTADDLGTPEKKTPDTGLWKMPEDLKAKDKDTRIAQGFPGEGTFQEDPITKLIKIIIGGIVVGTAATMDAAHDLYRDVMKSKTSREGDNHVTKRIRAEAGRNGDPCKIWEAEMEALEIAVKSTRNPKEIKELNKAKREMQKAGKQLGCDNKQKRKNEKGGDYGNIK